MSRLRFLAWRTVGMVASIWGVFTLVFAAYATRIAIGGGLSRFALGGDELPAAADAPVYEQYVDWLVWLVTVPDPSVTDPVVEAAKYTVAYLLPALVLAIVLGTGVRLLSVFADRGVVDDVVGWTTIVAVSIPVFLLGFLLRKWLLVNFFEFFDVIRIYVSWRGPWSKRNLIAALWPGTTMAVYLLSIQSRYAGEELRTYAGEEFVKTAKAKGVSNLRVARHVFRNTAITLLTTLLTGMFGMVVVGIFVIEFLFSVNGLGTLMIGSAMSGDVELVLALSVVYVAVGTAANFVQDVAHMLFDPRADVVS